MAEKPKPFVTVACLCDKALLEKDDTVSVIRIIDTIRLDVPADLPQDVRPLMSVTLFIGLKMPGFTGSGDVGIVLHGPTKTAGRQIINVKFGGTEDSYTNGANLIVSIALGVGGYGNCRIDVDWEGEPLTTIPFRLVKGSLENDSLAELPR